LIVVSASWVVRRKLAGANDGNRQMIDYHAEVSVLIPRPTGRYSFCRHT
jgi:hypothetical protein